MIHWFQQYWLRFGSGVYVFLVVFFDWFRSSSILTIAGLIVLGVLMGALPHALRKFRASR